MSGIISTPTLTVRTPIAFGAAATSAGVNNQVGNSGGLNDFVQSIDALTVLTGDHSSATNITADTNPVTVIDCTSGTGTANLPASSSNTRVSVTIRRKGNNFNTLTINANGTDKIENPLLPLATATASSITLRLPGESVTLRSTGTGFWEVLNYYYDTYYTIVEAFKTGSQALTANTFTKVTITNEAIDYGGNWDTVNSRYTAPVKGEYSVSSKFEFQPGSSTDLLFYGYKNGSQFKIGDRVTNAGAFSGGILGDFVLNSGDFLEAYVRSVASGSSVAGTEAVGYFHVNLKRRLP